MKPTLLPLLLFGLSLVNHNICQAKKDTTVIYCNQALDKVKKKGAPYYAKIYQTADGKTGVQQFNWNGTCFMAGTFMSKKLKIKDGEFTYFNSLGHKAKEGMIQENMATGLWQYFANNGTTVVSEGNYLKDKRNGEWKYYSKDGRLEGITTYTNGDYNGPYLEWANDTLVTKGQYVNDTKDGKWNSWFKEGQKDYEGIYKNGEREGLWKFYHPSGPIAASETYNAGKLEKVEWFDEDGQSVPVSDELEVEPQFPGGMKAMMNFIVEEVNYPETAREFGLQGIVYVQFIINLDGSLTDISIRKGVCASLDAESIRVVKKMPNWIPGMDHNRRMPILFTLPIHFRLG